MATTLATWEPNTFPQRQDSGPCIVNKHTAAIVLARFKGGRVTLLECTTLEEATAFQLLAGKGEPLELIDVAVFNRVVGVDLQVHHPNDHPALAPTDDEPVRPFCNCNGCTLKRDIAQSALHQPGVTAPEL